MASSHGEIKNSSLKEIEHWIAELYGDDQTVAPQFIDTPESRNLISYIIQQNKEAEKDAEVMEEMSVQLSQKYHEKNEEINCLLPESVIKDINPDALKRVEGLAIVANSMNLKLPTLTNFLFGISALEQNKMEQDEKELIFNHELSEVSQKISDIMKKNEILKREVKRLENVSNDQQPLIPNLAMQLKFISSKINEYNHRIRKSKKHLKSRGYDDSLSHGHLVARSERVRQLEEKLKKMISQLGNYQDLPPNEAVTMFKIEEAKKELTKLQNDFDALVLNTC